MGKNKKRDRGKVNERTNGGIKIVDSPTKEFTFVEDIYTTYRSTNNTTTTSDFDENNCKDTKKLSDIRNKNKIDPIHDLRFKSKGRNIISKQGHSPVYE
jgi:hypothetical protein